MNQIMKDFAESKVFIYVESEDEAVLFAEECNKHGITWRNGGTVGKDIAPKGGVVYFCGHSFFGVSPRRMTFNWPRMARQEMVDCGVNCDPVPIKFSDVLNIPYKIRLPQKKEV